MIRQRVLPFKIEMTRDTITPHAGLALVGEFTVGLGLLESVEWVVPWHNQRGDCSENRIKELKIGFGMERMPCGQFETNAVLFRIGLLAYNLYRLFILKTLDKSWHRHQVQTVRWRLYQIVGKIVFHGGQIFLKVRRRFCQLFNDVRLRIWEFAST